MTLLEWMIVLLPLSFVMYMGWYSRRFIAGVADFMVAGRVCHRYVITTADLANAMGLVTLVAFVEVHYKTGFALTFWNSIMQPIVILCTLTGYCLYRFRETRAMSIGQFLEMRYSRSLRIFACFLRSIAEMMANVIMPALAARFFIAYLDLPRYISILGWQCPTFMIVILITLTLAISLICFSGSLSIIITDTLQGLICFPLLLLFIGFVLFKFSWSEEIVTVMTDRAPGESFMNPYDISQLRDFNIFMLIVMIFGNLMHKASGVTGGNNAAKSPHEGKMSSILGSWRSSFSNIFYVVIAVMMITVLNHRNHAECASAIRNEISRKVSEELEEDPVARQQFLNELQAIPPARHVIGQDRPLSQKENLDEPYFKAAQRHFGTSGKGSSKTQQFKTMFQQLMLPVTMRNLLPRGMVGLFCLVIIMLIVSTDDSRIYSASSTLVQDCVVPFCKHESLTPERHILLIRCCSIGVGVFFLCGAYLMSQLDYINMFIKIMYGIWLGGCGPMIIFGFYSRFGTTAGAWSSLLSGMSINLTGIVMQRNWADIIYPWLERHELVEAVQDCLTRISGPFNPYVVWEMQRLKCPINSYEFYFMAMAASLIVYLVVSYLTCREPFNLERMLHRGKYAIDGVKKPQPLKWSFKNVFVKIIGINAEYSRGDKIIAWSVFLYSFVYKFIIAFVLVVVWNIFQPWPAEWWGRYFLVVSLVIPGIAAAITAVWFSIGGIVDLKRMFRDLKNRVANPQDNGMVSGHISLNEKEIMEKLDTNDSLSANTNNIGEQKQ